MNIVSGIDFGAMATRPLAAAVKNATPLSASSAPSCAEIAERDVVGLMLGGGFARKAAVEDEEHAPADELGVQRREHLLDRQRGEILGVGLGRRDQHEIGVGRRAAVPAIVEDDVGQPGLLVEEGADRLDDLVRRIGIAEEIEDVPRARQYRALAGDRVTKGVGRALEGRIVQLAVGIIGERARAQQHEPQLAAIHLDFAFARLRAGAAAGCGAPVVRASRRRVRRLSISISPAPILMTAPFDGPDLERAALLEGELVDGLGDNGGFGGHRAVFEDHLDDVEDLAALGLGIFLAQLQVIGRNAGVDQIAAQLARDPSGLGVIPALEGQPDHFHEASPIFAGI